MNARKLISGLVLCLMSLGASAWSGTEHKIMADIAQEHLTPATQAVLDRYFDSPLCEYANWMDRYRRAPGYEMTDAWHMTVVGEDNHSLPRDERGQAFYALQNAIGVLQDYKNQSDSTVFVNLLYIVHLVPEIHCPSHLYLCSLGGFDKANEMNFRYLKFKGVSKTYHSLWDSSITIVNPSLNLDEYRTLYDTWTPVQQKAAGDGTVEAWLCDIADKVQVIYSWEKKNLENDFFIRHRELPEELVRLASYRLARVLNTLFDPDFKSEDIR